MSKELLLVFNFKTAPAELQKAAEAHKESEMKVLTLKEKLKTMKIEMAAADEAFSKTESAYMVELNKWEPTKIK